MSVLYKNKTDNSWKKVAGIVVTSAASGLPDWDHLVEVTEAQVYNGYTCPDNGYIIAMMYQGNQIGEVRILVNGIQVGTSVWTSGTFSSESGGCFPVSKGDVVTKSTSSSAFRANVRFIPWKK